MLKTFFQHKKHLNTGENVIYSIKKPKVTSFNVGETVDAAEAY